MNFSSLHRKELFDLELVEFFISYSFFEKIVAVTNFSSLTDYDDALIKRINPINLS